MSEAEREATRAAYIARVVSEAPPLSDATLDRIAVLLRPTRAAYIESLLADWPAPSPQQRRTIENLLGGANTEANEEKDQWNV